MALYLPKHSTKGRTVVPAEIRKRLNLRPGDTIAYEVRPDGRVDMRKIEPLDAAFMRLASDSFAEWSDPETERAFGDLISEPTLSPSPIPPSKPTEGSAGRR